MLKKVAIVAVAVMLTAACGGGGSESDTRRVLVDFEHDDFASFVAANFPEKITALPGQTILFAQQWTGEPHTITSGTSINNAMGKGSAWLDFFSGYSDLQGKNPDLIGPDEPGDASFAEFARNLKEAKPAAPRNKVVAAYRSLTKTYAELPSLDSPPDVLFSETVSLIDRLSDAAFDGLYFVDNFEEINQNIGQPCYLKKGTPPEGAATACTKAQQSQPVFDGTYSFYNSGVLPYEGPRGNSYPVKLAEDIKPGTYFFYCAVHGPSQSSEVEVVKPGTEIPSAREVARSGLDEAEKFVLPLEKVYKKAVRTNTIEVEGETINGPFSGLPSDGPFGAINEFVPKTIRAKVNETITWKMLGALHSVSFDVPEYLPIIEFSPSRIRLNPKVQRPAGGSPKLSEPPDDGIYKVDGGTYDGTGFWSSGLFSGDPYAEYSLKISKPGSYNYACLVHPKMIGKVVVTKN